MFCFFLILQYITYFFSFIRVKCIEVKNLFEYINYP